MTQYVKNCYKKAIFDNENTLYRYKGNRGNRVMKNLSKNLSAILLTAIFATMQIASAEGLSNSTINSATDGLVGVKYGENSMALEFNKNTHVDWKTLNLNSKETLNFNASDGVSGLTVLNTVSGGQMSQIYGKINSNAGIDKLIISNPSGMMFDGANFTTAGDLMLTTQKLTPIMNGNEMSGYKGINSTATGSVTMQNSVVSVGGEFNITAPDMNIIQSAISSDKNIKFITRDGVNYLVSDNNGAANKGVRLESVDIDGDVYIVSGKDYVKVVNGGVINGNMSIDSDGIVALNYVNNDQKLSVKGDLSVDSDGALNMGQTALFNGHGNMMYLRNADVDGDLHMANSGGFLEVKDINVGGNADLTTTTGANTHVKHFVHVIGDSTIGGNLDIDSANNIHIGNYDIENKVLLPGSLKVNGELNANADYGHVMVTIDTQADKINLKSNQLNVLSDDKAVLKAREYKFEANGYIGGIGSYTKDNGETVDGTERIIALMENYTHIPGDILAHKYMNVDFGTIKKLDATPNGTAYIKGNSVLTVEEATAKNLCLTAVNDKDPLGGVLTLKSDVNAEKVFVGGETRVLVVPLKSRNYELNYVRINGTEDTVIDGNTEITYDMLESEPNGYNVGIQTAANTKIKAPAAPPAPDEPTPDEPTPDEPTPDEPTPPDHPTPPDNDNVKFLNNMSNDPMATAVNAGQVYTPIAFAGDLDEEQEHYARRNVDGTVTVVKPYISAKK